MNFIKKILCFDTITTFTPESLLYFSIELILIIFFIISCYNTDRLIRFKDEDVNLRNGITIAVESVVIFIGLFLFYIWHRNKKLSQLQMCFFGHIAPFLILNGIFALIGTIKRIENSKST